MEAENFIINKVVVNRQTVFTDMDPTVLVRLHSILTNRDVFILNSQNDYSIKIETSGLISMKLPADMIAALKNLNSIKHSQITKKWLDSKEVRLNRWDVTQCREKLNRLTRLANQGRDKIVMSLNTEVMSY